MAKSKGELPPGEPVPEKRYPTGHENGGWMNDDQRGGHTPPPEPEKFPAAAPMDPGLLADITGRIQEKAKAIEAAEAKPPIRRKLDPELKAMDAVCELLEDLTEQQRWRVINWALSRFMVENNGNLPKSTSQG